MNTHPATDRLSYGHLTTLVSSLCPVGGRFCVRPMSSGVIVVGLLHLPKTFRPEEGTSYPMLVSPSQVAVMPTVIDAVTPDIQASGISHWAGDSIWREVNGGIAIRMVKALDRENGWSLVGVSRSDPFAGALDAEHRNKPHYWVDIEGGDIVAIPSPVDEKKLLGTGVAQLLSGFHVWPGLDGKLYSLPTNCSYVNRDFLVVNTLRALRANEMIDDAGYREVMRACPHLHELGGYSTDRQYEQMLGLMLKQGKLKRHGAETADQAAARNKEITAFVRGAMGLDDPEVPTQRGNAASSDPQP